MRKASDIFDRFWVEYKRHDGRKRKSKNHVRRDTVVASNNKSVVGEGDTKKKGAC